ncbi:MAG: rhodanese-like domain-containing protein [Propionivibrio sp.]
MRRLLFALVLSLPCLADAQTYLLDGVKSKIVIDVRTPEEFATGHVDGALNIPYDAIKPDLPALAKIGKDENIVLYCRSGRRSAIAKQTLNDLGYRSVQDGGGLGSLTSRLKVCQDAGC